MRTAIPICAVLLMLSLSTAAQETGNCRGDINLNDRPYEIADLVAMVNYLTLGKPVPDSAALMACGGADCNGDGISFHVSDYFYLLRVVIGDAGAQPPPLRPLHSTYRLEHGVLSVDYPIGAARLVVDGPVQAVSLVDYARITTGQIGDKTTIMLWDRNDASTFEGQLMDGIYGNVVSVQFSSPRGEAIDAIQLLPESFHLFQNYPNPFNPGTTIEFAMAEVADYTLTITTRSGGRSDQRPAGVGGSRDD